MSMQTIENTPKTDKERIKNIKNILFDYGYKKRMGHLASSLSALEILYTLYNKITDITLKNASDTVRDRVIISKEHCRWAQTLVLYECGLLDKECVETFMDNGGLISHDIYNVVGDKKIAPIDVSIGSLGHGLGVGAGYALGSPDNNIYVIVGDGELQEGTCWEAIMFVGQNKLKNFTMIIDRNYQQADDMTKYVIDTDRFSPEAIKAFDFDIYECDGHNVDDLERVLKIKSDKPKCIVANTIKGKEMRFMLEYTNFACFHGCPIQESEYNNVMKELENA